MRRALLRAFTEADWRELREDYGATEAMLEELRRLAADDTNERDVVIDFEQHAVTVRG